MYNSKQMFSRSNPKFIQILLGFRWVVGKVCWSHAKWWKQKDTQCRDSYQKFRIDRKKCKILLALTFQHILAAYQ